MEVIKGRKALAAFLLALWLTVMPAAAGEALDTGDWLVPGGTAIGIQLEADGLLVVGITEVQTAEGCVSPAWDAGLRAGDLITAVGAVHVTTARQLREALALAEGQTSVRLMRGGKEMQLTVAPARSIEGAYELGVWLRSGLSGIGTITFYEPKTGFFGALGHAVSDADTGVLLPLKTGFIGVANVDSIIRGAHGKPGELKGAMGLEAPVGGILFNTTQGIFGYINPAALAPLGGEAVRVCPIREAKCGPAVILSDVGGEKREYQAELTRIYNDPEKTRDMLITVTDPALIEATGGIVQGMSGSPILQNGRLVGAVTHVLVNEPTKGYGIFLEHMLEAAACHS